MIIRKICLAFFVVFFAIGIQAPKSAGMNYDKGIKIASTLDLCVSFSSNVVRCVYEDKPATAGVRALYSPLGWVENKWVRMVSNLFLIFPAINVFSPKYELQFCWAGAVPAFCVAASTLGDGVCYLLAKCGCYKNKWKTAAANRLTNCGQQEAADWVNTLP